MIPPSSEINIAPLHLMKGGGGGAEKRAVELRASLELAAVKNKNGMPFKTFVDKDLMKH